MEPLFCIKSKPMVLNREPLGSVSENFEILYAQAILEFPNLPGLSGDDTQLRTVMQQCWNCREMENVDLLVWCVKDLHCRH